MSVTVTSTTVRPAEVMSLLGDYELHHSGGPGSPESRAPPPNPRPDFAESSVAPNPPNWPTQYRDVPPHRPINHELDPEQRPGGMNGPERVFIGVLMHGVGVQASISQLWARSGQKLFGKNMFKYDIGGEW